MLNFEYLRRKILSQKTIAQLVVVAIFSIYIGPKITYADTLSGISDSLSNDLISQTATHTVGFTTATTSSVKQINIRFSTTQGGSTKPAGMSLSSATLGTPTGLDGSWSLDTSFAANGLLSLTRASSTTINNSTSITIPLDNVTNPALNDCGQAGDTLTDVCQVRVTTFSDDGSTSVDSGDTTFLFKENPNLTFEVKSVSTSQTHNSITTNFASTPTTLSVTNLRNAQVAYITQEIVVTTNAPHGFKVNTYLANPLEGVINNNNAFSPFGATDATWSTPQNWETPTGDTASSNTGWLAANTTDTGVSGWSSASQKFGPISSTPQTVAISTSPARGGMSVFVTYAIGVNSAQPADFYSGKLVYEVQATY